MQFQISTDKIRLRQRKSQPGTLVDGDETITTLSSKLDELFAAGYEKDDIYGLVIPLLMQGKVRIDLEGRSERLEIDDQTQRMQRSDAIRTFEDYLTFCRSENGSRKPAISTAV